jgi:LPXTG-site transpeptidase (sortase) family protein
MKPKISSNQTLTIVFLIGFIVSAVLYSYFTPRASTGDSTASLAGTEYTELLPMHLRIPAIAVDASVEEVGIAIDGLMDTPKEPGIAGWLKVGPRPGEEGTAVIAGHFGWKNNTPAIFDDLNKLNKGDKIYVEDGKGNSVAFEVREIRIYDEKEIVANVFSSSDGKAHLNLITCEGVWDKTMQSYSNRLVVFADRI